MDTTPFCNVAEDLMSGRDGVFSTLIPSRLYRVHFDHASNIIIVYRVADGKTWAEKAAFTYCEVLAALLEITNRIDW